MHPDIHLNWPAILVAIVASFVFGGLWFGPLFGKAKMREVGVPPGEKPKRAGGLPPLAINVIGTFLTAYVMAHEVSVWRPSAWRLGPDSPPAVYGFFAGFFTWLGFAVPVLL